MRLSALIRPRPILRIASVVLAAAGLLALPGCWVYSTEPLYEEHLPKPDPDLIFDQTLVGSWGQVQNDCPWILTILGNQQAFELTMAPGPECKTEDKATRYEGHLVNLDKHRFLDIAAQSDDVCDLCLPLHTFLLVSQENDNLVLVPIDLDWMTQALTAKKVVLDHLQRKESSHEVLIAHDAVVLTASSKELKEFARKYADDKAVFKSDSDATLKFRRR